MEDPLVQIKAVISTTRTGVFLASALLIHMLNRSATGTSVVGGGGESVFDAGGAAGGAGDEGN